MTHRERVLKALSHQEPDRVPIDLGGTDASTIMIGPYRRLRQRLGLPPRPVRVVDPMEQCVWLDEDLRAALDVDVAPVPGLPRAWQTGRGYDGEPVEYPAGLRLEVLPDGSQVVRTAQGDIDLRMPAGAFYFDPVYHPLRDATSIADLDRARELIQSYDRPAYLDLSYEDLAGYARTLRETTDAVLVGQFFGHIFQAAQLLRGWETFMMDLVADPGFAEALMAMLAEGHMQAFERYAETVGKYVDVVQVNDDLGMQNGPWVSPELYRQRIKPYHARLWSFVKAKCSARLWLHSDGAIASLIPDLIEMGIEVLNPVQYTAAGMETSRLKREFGADLSFWGGGIDTQGILPFHSPREVAEEVRRRIDDLAPGGGFVFAAVHNIQEGVPVENVLALYETALEYGRY